MGERVLREKSYAFALGVIRVYKQIVSEHKEFVLSKQFLKAGTATGALVYKAEFAQSKADFVSKLSIALKESNETTYWISLLRDSDYIVPQRIAIIGIFVSRGNLEYPLSQH
ncbi:MAG: four helix bundle protein [Parabacteroides sp.]|nr:four helix bundle protein [Parabacteroides sp.]